ncbi:MAG: ATP-dependent Clp protease ATP-binding subunit [Acholeplasmatales bacterium]|nr:ATP-dependent Clp protease ATP-binding subunit [Acholeplasmatales bacterium]
MELNIRTRQILELAKKYSNEHNISTMGSEFLILAMFETEDSLCHFLLNEYEVTKEEIEEKTNQIFILRKKEGEYNKSLESILNQAQVLAKDKPIAEEHLFMSVLMVKNTIAIAILESLGLNIDDLIEDVKEIYDFQASSTDELPYIKNITKLAKNGELQAFIERNNYLYKMDVIMHRRFKNNPLLIGNAGVGKTALVEGYAGRLVAKNSDITILSLNLTAMLAGTRYRGDFEERFDKFMKEIASKKNVVIFIDEIHTIMGAATTDGNLDVANMLKPFLARSDIRLIGATTLEEYHKTIEKDKALLRRFQPVFVSEPSIEETKKILYGIKGEYEKYHNVKVNNETIDYILFQSDKKIVRRFRPDKCIDVLDDAMSLASINNKGHIDKKDVDLAIEGISLNDDTYVPKYKELEKYLWLYKMDLLDSKPLLKLSFTGSYSGYKDLIDDILNLYNIGYESLLEIDLNSYKDGVMLSSLIGAPPGYVGYDDEGILSKHLLEYPMSILAFKGFDKACGTIKSFILNMILRGSFVDQRGRKIELNNTIIIIEGVNKKKEIGFSNIASKSELLFDEEIIGNIKEVTLNQKYKDALNKLSYEVSFDFDININNKRKVDNYLFTFLKGKEKGKYDIKINEVELNKN